MVELSMYFNNKVCRAHALHTNLTNERKYKDMIRLYSFYNVNTYGTELTDNEHKSDNVNHVAILDEKSNNVKMWFDNKWVGWIKKMARGFIISVECTEMNTSCITFGKFKDFRHMSEMLGKFADLSIC